MWRIVSKKSFIVPFILFIGLHVHVPNVAAQCTKDTDCKGDRICNDGVCVDSPPPPADVELETVGTAQVEPPAQPRSQSVDMELRSIHSQRRIGRALLFSGIGALGFGLVFQAGWALEDCWYVYDPDEREICELSSLGETLVIGGMVLGGLGVAGIITGAIIAGTAKRKLSDSAAWVLRPSLSAGLNGAGLDFQLTF